MEHRTVGKGEALIVHITGRGLIDRAAQVTTLEHERPNKSQEYAQSEAAWDLRDKPATGRYSP